MKFLIFLLFHNFSLLIFRQEAFSLLLVDFFVFCLSFFCVLHGKLQLHNSKTDEIILNIINDIVTEYQSKDTMHMLAVQSGIHSLLILIARKTGKTTTVQREKHNDTNLSFYHILEYIDTHSNEHLEVKKLADKCHMSYSNFARLFHENYGRSCKEYILYIRLNKAQDLLLNSDFDLNYIAQETGFFDCSHFIRTYKKWRGITPKQERMKNKESL